MAKILIVDDEATIRELFKYTFEDAGHEVALAGNGLEALDYLQGDTPAFIVLDVSMPAMSGKEFVIELRKRAVRDPRLKEIPFVVMTGENFMDGELNAVFASLPSFACFFPKMTPPETVLAKAEEILAARG